jgi:hypothetical protein
MATLSHLLFPSLLCLMSLIRLVHLVRVFIYLTVLSHIPYSPGCFVSCLSFAWLFCGISFILLAICLILLFPWLLYNMSLISLAVLSHVHHSSVCSVSSPFFSWLFCLISLTRLAVLSHVHHSPCCSVSSPLFFWLFVLFPYSPGCFITYLL